MVKKPLILKYLDIVLQDVKQKIAAIETIKLRQNAVKNHGWSTEIAATLMVVPHEKGLHVNYPTKHRDAILLSEYGTQDTPPAPAIRSFMLGG